MNFLNNHLLDFFIDEEKAETTVKLEFKKYKDEARKRKLEEEEKKKKEEEEINLEYFTLFEIVGNYLKMKNKKISFSELKNSLKDQISHITTDSKLLNLLKKAKEGGFFFYQFETKSNEYYFFINEFEKESESPPQTNLEEYFVEKIDMNIDPNKLKFYEKHLNRMTKNFNVSFEKEGFLLKGFDKVSLTNCKQALEECLKNPIITKKIPSSAAFISYLQNKLDDEVSNLLGLYNCEISFQNDGNL